MEDLLSSRQTVQFNFSVSGMNHRLAKVVLAKMHPDGYRNDEGPFADKNLSKLFPIASNMMVNEDEKKKLFADLLSLFSDQNSVGWVKMRQQLCQLQWEEYVRGVGTMKPFIYAMWLCHFHSQQRTVEISIATMFIQQSVWESADFLRTKRILNVEAFTNAVVHWSSKTEEREIRTIVTEVIFNWMNFMMKKTSENNVFMRVVVNGNKAENVMEKLVGAYCRLKRMSLMCNDETWLAYV